jgi:hypothetical protein
MVLKPKNKPKLNIKTFENISEGANQELFEALTT